MRRLAVMGLALVLAAQLGGCSSGRNQSALDESRGPGWPYHHGEASSAGAIPAGSFAGLLDVVWTEEVPGKTTGPLTLAEGVLAVSSSKNRIMLFRTSDGAKAGKLKSKGAAVTGLIRQDSLGFFAVAPGASRLVCLKLRDKDEVWRRTVRDAAGGAILAGGYLLVGEIAGKLSAYDPADGAVAWSFEVEKERFVAPASEANGTVYQPGASGVLYGLSAEDGTEVFRTATGGPMVGGVAAADVIVGTDVLGNVYGIDPQSGAIRWTTNIGGPIWTTPATANGTAYIGHSGGELAALRTSDGQERWRFLANEVISASAIVVGSYVVVGTLGGNLYVLEAADGTIRDKRRLEGGIEYGPVSDGDRVYVATNKGKVYCLGRSGAEEPARAEGDQ